MDSANRTRGSFIRIVMSSIQAKLAIVFLVSCLIPITIITLAVFRSASHVIYEKDKLHIKHEVDRAQKELRHVLSEINQATADIARSQKVVLCLLSQEAEPDLDWFFMTQDIYTLLRNASPSTDQSVNFTLVGKNSRSISSERPGSYLTSSQDRELMDTVMSSYWKPYQNERVLDNYYQTAVITFSRAVLSNGEPVGVITADLDKRYIDSLFAGIDTSIGIQIIHQDGSILYERSMDSGESRSPERNDSPSIRSQNYDSNRYWLVQTELGFFLLRVNAYVPIVQVLQDSKHLQLQSLFALLVFVILSLVFTLVVRHMIVLRVRSLSIDLQNFTMSAGAKLIPVRPSLHDEIAVLESGTHQMSLKISNLLEEIKHNEARKRSLEIAALQSQVNPHMLYNTINTITQLANIQGISNIAEVSESFAKMMRVVSKTSSDKILISQEIEYIESYLRIKSYQILGTIETEIFVDPSLERSYILKLLIQPFVENAIVHGFRGRIDECKLKISIMKQGENVRIEVVDNGNGMDKATVEEIRLGSLKEKDSFLSVGIKNTVDRLRLHYQENYSFEINSMLGHGTTVVICFPWEEKNDYGTHS